MCFLFSGHSIVIHCVLNISAGNAGQQHAWLTRRRGAISLTDGTCLRSAKLRMRFLFSRYSIAAMPTYCDADVANAAPATPQPNTKMNMMSIVKFAMLASAAEIKGVLHKAHTGVRHKMYIGEAYTCSALIW